ncbi:hypothetical protein lerEdw1_009982, partial [Lerista edwardsae]
MQTHTGALSLNSRDNDKIRKKVHQLKELQESLQDDIYVLEERLCHQFRNKLGSCLLGTVFVVSQRFAACCGTQEWRLLPTDLKRWIQRFPEDAAASQQA